MVGALDAGTGFAGEKGRAAVLLDFLDRKEVVSDQGVVAEPRKEKYGVGRGRQGVLVPGLLRVSSVSGQHRSDRPAVS